jgi:preprotein translocase subunit SecB
MNNISRTLNVFLFFLAILGCSPAFAAAETGKPVFEVQRIYLKALELKQPNSPAIFLETETPKITLSLKTEPTRLDAETYEVSVSILLEAHIKGKLAYSVNATQAGVFTVKNVPARQLPTLQGVSCPNIVYPYLRANIADAITRAGFAPVNLAEVNWEVHYAQQNGSAN